ncbi:MAG: M28 family peptidase, partial [bacterium]
TFKKVKLEAHINSRHYPGILPIPHGLLKGRNAQEVIAIAHIYEQGANDNASGGALLLECSRLISTLIKKGALPRPKRSIRFVFSSECYGAIAFAWHNPDIVKRAVACIVPDCVCSCGSREGNIPNVYHNPDASASFTDTLFKEILLFIRTKAPEYSWKDKKYNINDNIIADPAINIPGLYIGFMDKYLHSSGDIPENYSSRYLKFHGVACAIYLYFIANANLKQAAWLAEKVLVNCIGIINSEITKRIELILKLAEKNKRYGQLMDSIEFLDYRIEIGKRQILSVQSLFTGRQKIKCLNVLKKHVRNLELLAEPWYKQLKFYCAQNRKKPLSSSKIPQAWRLIPVRLEFCMPHFERIPPALKKEYNFSLWNNTIIPALCWADGKRTIAQIIKNVKHETGIHNPRLPAVFRILEKYDYVRLKA